VIFGRRLPQARGLRVRVKAERISGGRPNGLDRLWRRSQRAFVGVQLHHIRDLRLLAGHVWRQTSGKLRPIAAHASLSRCPTPQSDEGSDFCGQDHEEIARRHGGNAPVRSFVAHQCSAIICAWPRASETATPVPFALDTSGALRGRSAYGILRQLSRRDIQPSTYRENASACRASSSIWASSALSLKSRQTLMSLPTPPPILTKGSMTTAPL
jgi:hypothetical protein